MRDKTYRARPAVYWLLGELESRGPDVEIVLPAGVAQALVDDIHSETIRHQQTAWLCNRRGERLEHHGIPNVYLSGCCGGDHRDLHTFAAQETGL